MEEIKSSVRRYLAAKRIHPRRNKRHLEFSQLVFDVSCQAFTGLSRNWRDAESKKDRKLVSSVFVEVSIAFPGDHIQSTHSFLVLESTNEPHVLGVLVFEFVVQVPVILEVTRDQAERMSLPSSARALGRCSAVGMIDLHADVIVIVGDTHCPFRTLYLVEIHPDIAFRKGFHFTKRITEDMFQIPADCLSPGC